MDNNKSNTFEIITETKVRNRKIAVIKNIIDGDIVFTVCIQRRFLFIFKYWSIIKSYVCKTTSDVHIQKYNAITKFNTIVKNGKF